MRLTGRRVRRLGTTLVVLGVFLVAYASAVVFWRDPATDVYAKWRQHQLSSELDGAFEAYRGDAAFAALDRALSAGDPSGPEARRAAVEVAARRFRRTLTLSDPIGRIKIPKLGIGSVFVHGTRWGADLSKGPGHYEQTSLPGLGKTTAIAGHRTTFGAPFRHIDELEAGDRIVIEMPYGTFVYRVFAHEIVDSGDWSVVRERGFDTLVLSACHPLYSSKQRWIVYARLARIELPAKERSEEAATAASGLRESR